jgi:hypothetical protein
VFKPFLATFGATPGTISARGKARKLQCVRLEPLDVWYLPKMGFVFVFIFSDFPAPSAAKWGPP